MVNRELFFEKLKQFKLFQSFTQRQVDSIEAILDECEKQGVNDIRQIAYIFATAAWEANNPRHPELKLTPMPEFGGETYLKSKPYYPYFGRGFSQLSWLANYKKEAKRLGLDLVNNPDLILDINIAANSHVYCMTHGTYTGKKLSDYINDTKVDFINARRIVNSLDRAADIASIAQKFLEALK